MRTEFPLSQATGGLLAIKCPLMTAPQEKIHTPIRFFIFDPRLVI